MILGRWFLCSYSPSPDLFYDISSVPLEEKRLLASGIQDFDTEHQRHGISDLIYAIYTLLFYLLIPLNFIVFLGHTKKDSRTVIPLRHTHTSIILTIFTLDDDDQKKNTTSGRFDSPRGKFLFDTETRGGRGLIRRPV